MNSAPMMETVEMTASAVSVKELSVEQFIDSCTSCGACTSECALLKTCGTPKGVISRKHQNVILCTNCGACTTACPSGLDPANAFLQAKRCLLNTGQVPDRVSKVVQAARRSVRWGRSYPFAHYSRAETVFWPGCSLAGMSPELLRETRRLLSAQLGRTVGIALDCCSDPAYQLGDWGMTQAATADIGRAFDRNGTTSVITACTNCEKIFSRYLPQVRVQHVLEILPTLGGGPLTGKTCYLHHPCPSYFFPSLQSQARRHLEGLGAVVTEPARPRCCGQGGYLPAFSSDIANACARETIDAAGGDIVVTTCMGCREQFMRQGKKTLHLLELIVDARVPDRPVSSMRKWTNRFFLAMGMRLRNAGM